MNIYEQLTLINKLPSKDTTIVDIGCGDGRVVEPFYAAEYKILGIDVNPDKIAQAKISMLNADFEVEAIEDFTLPSGNLYIIAKNSLPFLNSKVAINIFLEKVSKHHGYFSLFGEQDEAVQAKKAVAYSREEVDNLMKKLGGVILFIEKIGDSVNLKGEPRKSHKFEIYR